MSHKFPRFLIFVILSFLALSPYQAALASTSSRSSAGYSGDSLSRNIEDSDAFLYDTQLLLREFPANYVPQEGVDPAPRLDKKFKWIRELKNKLREARWNGCPYKLPFGQDTRSKINEFLIYVSKVFEKENSNCPKLVTSASSILRQLDLMQLQDQRFIDVVAKMMVKFEEHRGHGGYEEIRPFAVINAFISMAKVHAVPQNIGFFTLLKSKVDTIKSTIELENYKVECHTAECVDGKKKNLEDQDHLANVVIGFNMIPLSEKSRILKHLGEDFIPNIIDVLGKVIQTNKDINTENGKFLFKKKILQFFYWSVLLEKKTLSEDSLQRLKSFFGSPQAPIVSRTEERLQEQMEIATLETGEKFTDVYTIVRQEDAPYTRDLYTEIDFVIEERDQHAGARPIFFESDGPFHFIRRVDPDYQNDADSLTGQTFLKTRLLLTRGRVVRMSSHCDQVTYENRIEEMPEAIHRCVIKDYRFELVDPENYPNDLRKEFDPEFSIKGATDEVFPSLDSLRGNSNGEGCSFHQARKKQGKN